VIQSSFGNSATAATKIQIAFSFMLISFWI